MFSFLNENGNLTQSMQLCFGIWSCQGIVLWTLNIVTEVWGTYFTISLDLVWDCCPSRAAKGHCIWRQDGRLQRSAKMLLCGMSTIILFICLFVPCTASQSHSNTALPYYKKQWNQVVLYFSTPVLWAPLLCTCRCFPTVKHGLKPEKGLVMACFRTRIEKHIYKIYFHHHLWWCVQFTASITNYSKYSTFLLIFELYYSIIIKLILAFT